ncbi:hypothetical protein SY83_21210 [Paenibacillus swuensis]|uniref:HTH araC/xylS-type domain-containing protein n=1 Tax=Paenibacillus swuensis TaxID=1178515 RepID=A0A172TMR9_9BACL|nr:AraC family transcriptional regulator [Paenibacillus swuensis]ANE48379.1 hypothetical protein SY83_21210 [Paenibacillus swuensis]
MKTNYFLTSPVSESLVCYPVSMGRYNHFPEHAERREAGALAYYNIHLVFEGKGYMMLDNESVPLKAGDGFLYPKDAFQHYGTDPQDPWDVRWIHLEAALPFGLLRRGEGMSGWRFSFEDRERLISITEEMYALAKAFHTRSEPRMSALLYELLAELTLNYRNPEDPFLPGQADSIRAVADTVRERCHEPWTLKQMAELSGYSEFHFLRLFSDIVGRTPLQHLTGCRLAAAKGLLVSTRMRVGEVALAAGFSQASYFIKVFRKAEGVSPKEYRNSFG